MSITRNKIRIHHLFHEFAVIRKLRGGKVSGFLPFITEIVLLGNGKIHLISPIGIDSFKRARSNIINLSAVLVEVELADMAAAISTGDNLNF